METTRWNRVASLFEQAALLPEGEQQEFLAGQCPDDPNLVDEVMAMLEEDRRTTPALDADLERTVQHIFDLPGSTPAGAFGPYRLLRTLGEGGMGVVWLAERADIGTQVAIKFLLHAAMSPLRSRLFATEIRTQAQLRHQYIARLYDAGSTTDGTPWFAMEYVDGEPLIDYCASHSLAAHKRLQLFHSVCEAVQYAHSREVIHRDLKPSNILVESDGTPRLLDFGVAKQIHSVDETSEVTRPEFRLFTPGYSAPEWRTRGTVGFATDVYSLGIILFEMLAGRRPNDSGDAATGESPELLSAALREQLPRSALRSLGWNYGRSAQSDLDALCLRAMHPDPQCRYGSVEALLRDLDHFLNGEPLEARPNTLRYKTEKFVRRHLNLFAFGVVILGIFAGVVGYFSYRVARERNAAQAEAERTKRIELFMENIFDDGDRQAGPIKDLKVATLLEHGVQNAQALSSDPDAQADLYRTLGRVYEQLGDFSRANTLLGSALERSRQVHGPDSIEFGKDQLALGLLQVDEAQLPQAERSVREALAIESRHLPARHPAVVDAQIGLARVLVEQGKYDEAIEGLKRVLPLIPPGDAARMVDPVTRLADAYFYEGKYDLSGQAYQQALQTNIRLHGERHPANAELFISLGHIAGYAGDNAKSEACYRKALDIDKGWYGEDHPDTADAMNYVADALYWQNRDQEAAALLKPALDIMVRHYGENHPRVALIAGMSGMVADDMGNHDEARADFVRALNIYRAIYGPTHHMVAVELGNVGSVDQRMKHYALAEQEYREALRITIATQSSTHINTAIEHIRLGRVLALEKQPAAALGETLAGYRILVGKTDTHNHFLQGARQDLALEYEALHQPALATRYKAEYEAGQTPAAKPSK